MVSVSLSGGDPDWEAFYKTGHPDPYHWKATSELMVRLKEAIRTNADFVRRSLSNSLKEAPLSSIITTKLEE
jgi:hypothetical protein